MTAPAERNPASAPPRAVLAAAAVVGLCGCAVYAGALRLDFVNYDDPIYVVYNPNVTDGLGLSRAWWALTAGYFSNWHPLTWWSYQLDASLWGGANPMGFHLTNVLFHALNAALLLLLLQRATGRLLPAAGAALLFAVHPAHVESVAWVSQRKDVLSLCLGLLALHAYLCWARRRGAWRMAAVAALLALGLMAKPMLVTLPLLMLLLDYWPLRRTQGKAGACVAEKWPLYAIVVLSAVVTVLAQRAGGSLPDTAGLELPWRVANALVAYARYLGTLVWPFRLAVFYPLFIEYLTPGRIALGIVVTAGATAAAFSLRRVAPWALMGWLWFIVALLPMIGLIQAGRQAMADRYLYLPAIGFYIAVVWTLDSFAVRLPLLRRIGPPAAAVVLALLAWRTTDQLGYWRNSEALFEHALAVTSDNYVAQQNYALALQESGRVEEAVPHYREAVRLNPVEPKYRLALARALVEHGRPREAAEALLDGINRMPKQPLLHAEIGGILLDLGKYGEARKAFETAVQLGMRDAETGQGYAEALLRTGYPADAVKVLEAVLARDGDDARTHLLWAEALLAQDEPDEAAAHVRQALERDPDNPDAAALLTRLDEARGTLRDGPSSTVHPGS